MPGSYNQQSIGLHFEQTNKRLAAIEEQLKVLSEAAGVAYTAPMDEIPAEVIELAQGGDPLGAAKRLRELTGMGSKEAIAIAQGL
jgi:ribosomal protein L7/L12